MKKKNEGKLNPPPAGEWALPPKRACRIQTRAPNWGKHVGLWYSTETKESILCFKNTKQQPSMLSEEQLESAFESCTKKTLCAILKAKNIFEWKTNQEDEGDTENGAHSVINLQWLPQVIYERELLKDAQKTKTKTKRKRKKPTITQEEQEMMDLDADLGIAFDSEDEEEENAEKVKKKAEKKAQKAKKKAEKKAEKKAKKAKKKAEKKKKKAKGKAEKDKQTERSEGDTIDAMDISQSHSDSSMDVEKSKPPAETTTKKPKKKQKRNETKKKKKRAWKDINDHDRLRLEFVINVRKGVEHENAATTMLTDAEGLDAFVPLDEDVMDMGLVKTLANSTQLNGEKWDKWTRNMPISKALGVLCDAWGPTILQQIENPWIDRTFGDDMYGYAHAHVSPEDHPVFKPIFPPRNNTLDQYFFGRPIRHRMPAGAMKRQALEGYIAGTTMTFRAYFGTNNIFGPTPKIMKAAACLRTIKNVKRAINVASPIGMSDLGILRSNVDGEDPTMVIREKILADKRDGKHDIYQLYWVYGALGVMLFCAFPIWVAQMKDENASV